MGVRPYDHAKDAQVVRMLIGQGVMEGLAGANKNFVWHPLVLSVWVAAALALDRVMGWVPNFESGSRLALLKPLMGFATTLIPIVVLAEYHHRPLWTKLLRDTIGSPDLVTPDTFYTSNERSALLVFEHKNEVQGVIALDGSRPEEELGSVLGAEEKALGKAGILEKRAKSCPEAADSNTVRIRHFAVDYPFRRHGVGHELLVTALEDLFKRDPACRVIVYVPGWGSGGRLLAKCGFKRFDKGGSVGMLSQHGIWYEVDHKAYAT